jgi:hypothetical protein
LICEIREPPITEVQREGSLLEVLPKCLGSQQMDKGTGIGIGIGIGIGT